MTVYDTGTVDSVSIDEENQAVLLGLVVPGPIENEPELLEALTEKVNGYVIFVASGGLAEAFPQTEGLSPAIEIAHAGALDDWATRVVSDLQTQLAEREIGLRTVDLDALAEDD